MGSLRARLLAEINQELFVCASQSSEKSRVLTSLEGNKFVSQSATPNQEACEKRIKLVL